MEVSKHHSRPNHDALIEANNVESTFQLHRNDPAIKNMVAGIDFVELLRLDQHLRQHMRVKSVSAVISFDK